MNLFISYYAYQDNNLKLEALNMTFLTFLEGNVIPEELKDSFASCIIDIVKQSNRLYPSTKKIDAVYNKIGNNINIYQSINKKKKCIFEICLKPVDMALLNDGSFNALRELFKLEGRK